MIESFLSGNIVEYIISTFLCLGSGFLINLSIVSSGEKWAQDNHYRISHILLPFITFAVTKVISGNIALSLGMVGALSIIRFRTPIKSPYELTVFFMLITSGIAYTHSLKYGIFFISVGVGTILLFKFLKQKEKFSFRDNKLFTYTLDIKSEKDLSFIKENIMTKNFAKITDENNKTIYNY